MLSHAVHILKPRVCFEENSYVLTWWFHFKILKNRCFRSDILDIISKGEAGALSSSLIK